MTPPDNILASDTGGGTGYFLVDEPMGVFAFGTLGSDTGDVERLATDGSTWQPVFDAGVQTQLSATRPQLVIAAPGSYRVVFTDRDSAIGVDVQALPHAGGGY